MALDTLGVKNIMGARKLWQSNGGGCTRRDLLYCRSPEVRKEILRFLYGLPNHLDIEVNGHAYHLVHGYPAGSREERIWKRPETDWPAPISGVTAIIGHTPTVYLNGDDNEPFRIWHGNGVICIDCGCGNETNLRRLACLRLDDMEEFYV